MYFYHSFHFYLHLRVVVIVLALRMHLFGFRIGLGLGIDESRQKGSKEDTYPNTADQGNLSYKQHLTNIHQLKQE
jgi:hypothetical protein